jgi:hypothetical protein
LKGCARREFREVFEWGWGRVVVVEYWMCRS